jgi:hypothetical protein
MFIAFTLGLGDIDILYSEINITSLRECTYHSSLTKSFGNNTFNFFENSIM